MSAPTYVRKLGGMARYGPIPGILISVVLVTPAIAAPKVTQREAELRRNVAWQVALEAVGFSPGIIDGRIGPKTRLATREFQRVRGLRVTGELDPATSKALKVDPDSVIGRYAIDKADLAEIGPVPKGWIAKSKLKRLGHESLEAVLGERFHCSRRLLREMNPGRNVNRLKAGDKVVVPIVPEPSIPQPASLIEINLTEKVIRVIDRRKQLAALFHCSVAARKSKMPSGQAHVTGIAPDPWYTFDPKMWPEVKERIRGKLKIPPGPRNPVGRCWIALSLPGYGVHGTPNPELIGKTGSHGCFRLANWDAIRLSRMVRVGTPVRFAGHPNVKVASRR